MAKKFRENLLLHTLVALALGVLVGVVLGPRAAFLGTIGKALIQTVKFLATPLLFFAVLEAISSAQFKGRGLLWMLALCAFNGFWAIVIGLGLTNWLQPGTYLPFNKNLLTGVPAAPELSKLQKPDFLAGFASIVPESIFAPFVNNSVLSVIFLAFLFGFGLRSLRKDDPARAHLENFLHSLYGLFLKTIHIIARFIPIGVFGAVAKTVGEHGASMVRGLGAYLFVAIAGLLLQVILVYTPWIALFSRVGLRKFWKEAKEPVIYSFGVNSSLATLPITLRALERMKVSPGAARLSACVGTNFNNDGILLYEAMAAIFVAQVYGVHLTLPQQISASFVCIIATLGIAGIPDAGFISLALVLTSVGLPVEVLPVLLTVDWIIARCRSVTNVLSDLTGAAVLDRIGVEQ